MATLYKIFVTLSIISLLACSTNAQLVNNFYGRTCPNLETIVRREMTKAINNEARIGASILRLFFHDCFVNVSHFKIMLKKIICLFALYINMSVYLLIF